MTGRGAKVLRPALSAASLVRSSSSRPDVRLAGPAATVWITTLAMLSARPGVAFAIAGTAATAAGIALWAAPRRRTRTRRAAGRTWHAVVGAALAAVAAAAVSTGLRVSAVESGPVRAIARAGGTVTLVAVLTTEPTARPSRRGTGPPLVIARARAISVHARDGVHAVRVPLLILGRRPWLGLAPSQAVRFTARLSPPRPGALLAAVAQVRGPPTVLGPPSPSQRTAEMIRERLRTAASSLPGEQRGVLPGLVLGDTSRLDPRLAEEFRAAGLSHLMVVSGANLALVAGAILGLARLIGLGRRAAAVAAAVAVLAFVIVVRPEPSVLRATVMAMIGLTALVTGRERQGLPALSAAVLLLVLADPELAASYGFALSVFATGGLLILAPRWRERLSARLPAPCADAVAVAAAAQAAVTPLLVMMSGEVSLVAIPANVLAAPAVPPATLLGALTAAVAPLSMPLAEVTVWPAGLAVGWICGVAHVTAALPHAVLGWPAGVAGGLSAAAAGLLLVGVLRRRSIRRVLGAGLAGAVCVWFGAVALFSSWPPRGWLLVACDVGQGDALALATGPGRAVVIDTGPTPTAVDRCLRDLGVTAIPMLVLTHPHADHVGGVSGATRRRRVGAVLVSHAAGRGWGPRGGLSRSPAPVHEAVAGQRWTAGPLTLTVLGPRPTAAPVFPGDDGSAVNNASVVLLASWPGLSALLPGDAEEAEQRAVLAAGLPTVSVLKIPHHGSGRQDMDFLAAGGARVGLISVGRDNDYGHPAPQLQRMLRRLGIRAYRTDRQGDIAVVRSAGGAAVVPRGRPFGLPGSPGSAMAGTGRTTTAEVGGASPRPGIAASDRAASNRAASGRVVRGGAVPRGDGRRPAPVPATGDPPSLLGGRGRSGWTGTATVNPSGGRSRRRACRARRGPR